MPKRFLTLISDAAQTCGVEAFARHLSARLPDGELWALGRGPGGLLRRLRDVDGIVINLPIVAWKRRLAAPILAALLARSTGKEVVVVLHEWASLDWKRRIALAPVAMLATKLIVSAPEIAAEFARSPASALATADRRIVPIPPNLLPPAQRRRSAALDRLNRHKGEGRMILGQFGSIYPKKQPTAVLRIAERLLERGEDVVVVFIGSFIKGLDDVEADFERRVAESGLGDRVLVTGYVGDDRELFALFEAVEVFCYLFPEGLTARRASVLAAALVGRPVIVNAPISEDALRHHPLYLRLIEARAVRLVPRDADAAMVAEAVLAAKGSAPEPIDLRSEIDALWREAARTIAS